MGSLSVNTRILGTDGPVVSSLGLGLIVPVGAAAGTRYAAPLMNHLDSER
ncbi:hypothetical protein [Streptomyces sp. FIT100]|nr:hypothetical protein [Streptomyces sp. FIT100]UUN30648.1 hypothetical protein KK483_33180 [Streptomyces sp. FIT100]